MEGGHTIRKGTTPERKADWIRNAMVRMDEALGPDTRHSNRAATGPMSTNGAQTKGGSVARPVVLVVQAGRIGMIP